MANHSSTLAWKISWIEEPDRLQSMGSQRVGHDFTFHFSLYVEVDSFYAHFLKSFNHNGCWTLSKAFSTSIEIIIWFLSFNLLIWCITLIYVHILKNPCISGIKPTWSWYMSFSMCCWILFAQILLRIFASMFIGDTGLWFSFFCVFFVWLWY